MRKRGHLTASSLHEPQKKKQKTNLHTNNNQSNKTPHQTPNKPKPSPHHIFFNDTDFNNSTRKTTGFKQQQVTGGVKPWKPKRPVPTSRGPLPSSELALDGEEDFPRGWGKQPHKKQNKKKKKMNKTRQALLFQSDERQDSKSNHLFNMQNLASKNRKGEKKKNWKNYTNKVDAQLYYEEDNLFIIKQRRHKR